MPATPGRRATTSARELRRPQGRQRLPLLRRRLPDHLPHQGRQARSTSTGRDGPANQNRLCVKGRFGFDYVHQPAAPDQAADPQGRRRQSTPTIWSIPRTRGRISARRPGKRRWSAPPRGLDENPRPRRRRNALAGFGSAKGSNEEAYLFQKLVRTGFGTNNVDHCTRLCHASSVAALLEGVGSAAVTATFNECKNSDVIIVIGANPTENHPVAATFFKQAAKRGAKLIVMDPRGQALEAPRLADDAVQERHRRRDAQRACSTSSSSEKLYDQQYVQSPHRGLREARREREAVHAGGDGADLRHRAGRAAQGRAHLRARRDARSSSGAWASRSTPTAPTTRAA